MDGFQTSSLFNKANYVRRFQIGLINICDSIGGTPVGLLSIVKGGENNYNRFEISSSEMMQINFGRKFGVKSFYNMIHAGMRFKKGVQGWGLGYGIGFLKPWARNKDANFELMVMKLNEKEFWTKELNLLLSVKFLANIQIEDEASFFIGPVLNLLISKVQYPENNELGSVLVPYSFFELNDEGKQRGINQWVGFNAGFRF